jgi:hypothetical protein
MSTAMGCGLDSVEGAHAARALPRPAGADHAQLPPGGRVCSLLALLKI